MIDIKVPTIGESISEVTLLKWLKKDGDFVDRDEVIAELESEKATFEVNAEQSGIIQTIAKEGDTLGIGAVLANIDEKARKSAGAEQPKKPTLSKPQTITVEEPEEKTPQPEKETAPEQTTSNLSQSPVDKPQTS